MKRGRRLKVIGPFPWEEQEESRKASPVLDGTVSELRQDVIDADSVIPKKKRIDRCRNWILEQQANNAPEEVPETAPDNDEEPVLDDPEPMPNEGPPQPLRRQLKHYSEKEIRNSVMFECEWLRCGFETIDDLVYSVHVESHMQEYGTDYGEFCCHWDLCGFKTENRQELESHLHFHAYHQRMKTYGASLCQLVTMPKCNNDSRRRNSIEQFETTAFRCGWEDCGENFTKAQLFFMHTHSHIQDQFPIDRKSSKEEITCLWEGCSQRYKKRSIALEHMRSHSRERIIGCYTCGAIFVSRLKLIDHCRRQADYHNREFTCPECNKLFATKQLMNDHRHVHRKRFACSLCPMMWPSQKAMLCHIRYRHIDEKPFKCTICDHRTVTMTDLEIHILTHDDRRIFRCEEFGCDAAFKCQKSLKTHVDAVHWASPGIYGCHVCEKQFKHGGTLSKHLIKIHNFKRPPGYTRFTYRADRDGVNRLLWTENGDTVSNKPPPEEPVTADESVEEESTKPTSWTKFSCNKIETINENEFKIELQLDAVLPKPVHRKKNLKVESMSELNRCLADPSDCQNPTSSSDDSKPVAEQFDEDSNSEQMQSGEVADIATNIVEQHEGKPSATKVSLKQESVNVKQEPMDLEPLDSGSSTAKAEVIEVAPDISLSKNIDNFTVMKRYLGTPTEKPIVISFEETDSTGSVIRSETLETTEITHANLLQTNQ
ncbi:histone H4 transcription factor-like [Uranotaenia lowii]|uniref:histone H4 transcription factor-like n=1 Tax=Uranotaenia lowii TaxID=190385 RepID=UPI002479A74B|nr:histone H4 transcription factor-like [Uranotaenia lowii]